jgi:hypothetical protein
MINRKKEEEVADCIPEYTTEHRDKILLHCRPWGQHAK